MTQDSVTSFGKKFVLWGAALSLIGICFSSYLRLFMDMESLYHDQFTEQDHWHFAGLFVFFLMLLVVQIQKPERFLKLTDKTWVLGIGYGLFLAVCHFWVYKNRPYIIDEYCFDFQSQIFARGEMMGNWPWDIRFLLLPEVYHNHFFVMFESGDIFCRYWPGNALLRAPWTLLGVPWLWNTGLAVGCLYLVKNICRQLFGETTQTAAWAVLFLLASSNFSVNAISMYPNTFYIFSSLVFVALLLRPTALKVFCAGVIGSIAIVQHQPMPHALFAIPWFVWLLVQPKGLRNVFLLVLGYLPVVLVVGFGWALWMLDIGAPDHQGNPANDLISLLFNYRSELDWSMRPMARFMALFKLWAWAAPGLLLLAAYGFWKAPKMSPLKFLGYSCALTYAGYFFIHTDSGHGWGYRYFEGCWSALVLLGAAAIHFVQKNHGATLGAWIQDKAMFAVLTGVAIFVPARMLQVEQSIAKELADLPVFEDNGEIEIVFVDHVHHSQFRKHDLVQNAPFLDSPKIIIFGRDKNWNDETAERAFPNFENREKDLRRFYLPKELEEKPYDLSFDEFSIFQKVRY